MSCKREQYGPIRMDWGVYPLGEQHDDGGCPAEGKFDQVTASQRARVAQSKHNMEMRGGNNPYEFEACPKRLRYEVGTGCMNPGCMCHNCQGDCKCTKQGGLVEGFSVLGKDMKFWIVAIAAAYLFYYYMSKKPGRK